MARFLGHTWLATTIFALLSVGFMLLSGVTPRYSHTLTALLLTPILWRWFVIRQERPDVRRAALAGATLNFLILMLPLAARWAWFDARRLMSSHPSSSGLAGLIDIFAVLMVLGAVPVVGGIGAGVGSLIALAQPRQDNRSDRSQPADTLLVGAVRGCQVAVLAGPFTAFLMLALPRSILPVIPYGGPSYPILLLGAWLITIPAGALLGIGHVMRWRQIVARQLSTATPDK